MEVLNLVIGVLGTIDIFYIHINHFIMNFTVILGEGLGLTNFNHVSLDGMIKLAFNSPYNIIK